MCQTIWYPVRHQEPQLIKNTTVQMAQPERVGRGVATS